MFIFNKKVVELELELSRQVKEVIFQRKVQDNL